MDLETVNNTIRQKQAVALYFSAPTCNVCNALKPKLMHAFAKYFKELEIVNIDVSKDQTVAAHFSVFAIPTLIIFLDGKEFVRKSRHMSVEETVAEIARPYELMFS